jgi:hypothetical protein
MCIPTAESTQIDRLGVVARPVARGVTILVTRPRLALMKKGRPKAAFVERA